MGIYDKSIYICELNESDSISVQAQLKNNFTGHRYGVYGKYIRHTFVQ